MWKPFIKKLKLGNRITGYRASFCGITGEGKTEAEAASTCHARVTAGLFGLRRGTKIGRWNGHLYVISPTDAGFAYWIDTYERLDYFVTAPTFESAETSALRGLAQHMWTLDCESDAEFVSTLPAAVARDLMGYFEWQRTYARLIKAGHSDSQARDIAGGLKREN